MKPNHDFSSKAKKLIEADQASEARPANFELIAEFEALRNEARNRTRLCSKDYFPSPENSACLKDPDQFHSEWMVLWNDACDAIRNFGRTVDDVANLYCPHRDDPHILKQIRDTIDGVKYLFLGLYEGVPEKDVEREVRNLVGSYLTRRIWLQMYFGCLARAIGEIPYIPPSSQSPQTLFEARDKGVRHRDLAELIGAQGAPWYLKARNKLSRGFKGRRKKQRRGVPAMFHLGDLMAEFARLSGKQYGDRDLTSEFASKLFTVTWTKGES